MKLFTQIPFQKCPAEIKYQDSVIFIGSCFSDTLGQKLKKLKFNTLVNPFGTVYNPYSISSLIQKSFEKIDERKDIFENNGLYCHPDFHSSFCDNDIESCHHKIQQALISCRQWIENQNALLFITLGTSFVYKWKQNGEIVANCHKLPANRFEKYFLTTEESVRYLSTAIEKIRAVNPAISIVFTVSPVRHTRDGIVENARSKARLTECAHLLTEMYEYAYYFPSYELMNDELRDYRFYDKDLIHPNEIAEEIIWNRFCTSFIGPDTMAMIYEIEDIVTASEHRPFRRDTRDYAVFCEKYMQKIQMMNKLHPHLDFSRERSAFKSGIPDN
jgi:hypothetical protein